MISVEQLWVPLCGGQEEKQPIVTCNCKGTLPLSLSLSRASLSSILESSRRKVEEGGLFRQRRKVLG